MENDICSLNFEKQFKNFDNIENTLYQKMFKISVIVNKPPTITIDYLKIDNLKNIHPFIENIEKIEKDSITNYYKVVENLSYTIPLFNYTFNFRNTYSVAQRINFIDENKIVLMSIGLAKLGFMIRNKTIVSVRSGNTEIIEKSIINGNPILLTYAYKQAKESHSKMLLEIKKVLDNTN